MQPASVNDRCDDETLDALCVAGDIDADSGDTATVDQVVQWFVEAIALEPAD